MALFVLKILFNLMQCRRGQNLAVTLLEVMTLSLVVKCSGPSCCTECCANVWSNVRGWPDMNFHVAGLNPKTRAGSEEYVSSLLKHS